MKSIIVVSFLTVATLAAAQAQPPMAKVAATPQPAAVEVARLSFINGSVEIQHGDGAWVAGAEDQGLSSGDRLRTLKGSTARLEFPWTAVAVSDSTGVSFPRNRLLTLQLDAGRIDVDPEQGLMRIVTGEVTITGAGRTLVRREGTTTFVGSYGGGANVETPNSLVRLGIGKGTIVNGGAAPGEPERLATPPKVLSPASDPRYVRPGESVRLAWAGREPLFHLEVLPIDSDVPVVSIDVAATTYDLKLPWLGTFRWRVAGRAGPIETEASAEGLICVVEK